MSRSGYSDDLDNWAMIKWRGAVTSATKGSRGQTMLRELLAALDAMPVKRLAANSLATAEGEFCTLGVLGQTRGIDVNALDPDDSYAVAEAFGIARALACEIVFENDEQCNDWHWIEVEICGPMRGWQTHRRSVSVIDPKAAERRWSYMRNWVATQIKETK